jgi:hypothetical protein
MVVPSGLSVDEAIAWLRERIEAVPNRVACPTCHAPVGQPCRRVRAQLVRGAAYPVFEPVLKQPHERRLRADGLSLR